MPGIDILPHKTLTVHGGSKAGTLQDRRAMIEDTSSETSEDSCQLPYVAKKVGVRIPLRPVARQSFVSHADYCWPNSLNAAAAAELRSEKCEERLEQTIVGTTERTGPRTAQN